MKVLHIAHYDTHAHSPENFYNKAQNGIEQWLTDAIDNFPDSYEHYVLFFNIGRKAVFVQKINKQGEATVYTQYPEVDMLPEQFVAIFQDINYWLDMDIVHIHYLQDYVQVIPKILSELGVQHIIATMHDESYLASNYGTGTATYNANVAEFFDYCCRVVFINDYTQQKFMEIYAKELQHKTILISHGIDKQAHVPANAELPLVVLFLGNLNAIKGSQIVQNLTEQKTDDITYHLLGSIDLPEVQIIDHGRYTKTTLWEQVAAIQPDIIAVTSLAEETYSYVAAEATSMGIPVLTFSSGVLNTIENEHRGFVVQEQSTDAMLQKLLEIKELKRTGELATIKEMVCKVVLPTTAESIYAYQMLYESIVKVPNGTEIAWEYVFKRNLIDYKRNELMMLHQHHQTVMQQRAYEELDASIPRIVKKFFRKLAKIGEKK